MVNNFLINLLTIGTLISSILVITSKNPVIAVIYLISTFVNAAGYLIILGVGFIGITYIIVYVGAIAVLFLFVIMMIKIKLSDILETGKQYTKNIPLALIIGSLFLYELYTIIPISFKDIFVLSFFLDKLTHFNQFVSNASINPIDVNIVINPTIADINFNTFLHIQSIGQTIYTYGAFFLILASLILLLAMIAPIFLSKTSNNIKINDDDNIVFNKV